MTIGQYKRVELTKYLGLLLIVLAVLFSIIDASYRLLHYSYPLYIILLFIGITVYYLCVRGRQTWAAAIGLLTAYLVVFAFATDKALMDGIVILYIPCALAALLFFDPERKLLRYGFTLLAFVLSIVVRFLDRNLFSYGLEPALKYPVTFIIDFTLSLLLCLSLWNIFLKSTVNVERKSAKNQERLKLLSEALKESRARLLLANRGSKTGVYEWKLTDDQIFVSREWWSLLGIAVETEYIDKDFFLSLLHPDDRKLMMQVYQYEKAFSDNTFELEVRRRDKHGEYLWFLDRGMIGESGDDKQDSFIVSTMDINERKNNELHLQDEVAKLQQANKELGSFLNNASHDLRSPLNGIVGLIALAQGTSSLDEIKRYLRSINRAVRGLNELIIDISRYNQHANQSLRKDKLFLLNICQDILESLSYSADFVEVQISVDIPNDLFLYSDRSRLVIVLTNLLSNAIKYRDMSKAERIININAFRQESMIHILIEDNGIGMDYTIQEKVFGMFFRGYSKVEGSGLGLYITTDIVEKLSGNLYLCSVLGIGTAIKLIFPQQLND